MNVKPVNQKVWIQETHKSILLLKIKIDDLKSTCNEWNFTLIGDFYNHEKKKTNYKRISRNLVRGNKRIKIVPNFLHIAWTYITFHTTKQLFIVRLLLSFKHFPWNSSAACQTDTLAINRDSRSVGIAEKVLYHWSPLF